MLQELRRFIKRQPWQAQAVAWPLYGVAHAIGGTLAWAFAELTGQARAKAKKTFAPLLWPALGLLVVMILFAVLGEQGSMALAKRALGPAFALVMALYGLKYLVSAFRK
jgi:hypothetical protein